MAKSFSATTIIDRPIEDVFAFLADGTNDPKFSPRVLEISKQTDGPIGVGTVFVSKVKDAGMTTDREFELTGFTEPTQIRWTERSKNTACEGFKVKDPQKLRTRVNALKQTSDGSYSQCTQGSWQYNGTSTYATATVETWGGPHGPCGDGRYKAGAHQGLFNNGDWKVGNVDSPPHLW